MRGVVTVTGGSMRYLGGVRAAVVPWAHLSGSLRTLAVRWAPWFHWDAPVVWYASKARPSEDHARRQLARTGWAKEGCFQPQPATSKRRERLVRKPTARMTFAMPRFATQIDVCCSGRLRRLHVVESAAGICW